ncbi:MAG TPA: ABC transporter permease [Acetobacteraceae bacterium]|nr:ABC transporter permease [Acetobacteraceae bacterium]
MQTSARTSLIPRLSAVAMILFCWCALSWAFYSPRLQLFPPPWQVAQRFVQLLQTELPTDIAASLGEAAGGWVIGSLLGIALGTLIGRVAPARLVLRPVIDFLRFISPLAWVPLAILWFGIGYWSKAAIIVLISLFTVVVNTAHGMSSLDRETEKASRSLHLAPFQRVEVWLMSAMPDILVGLRYALGAAWGGVVISELVAGDTGIGAMESYGGQSFDVAQIMVGMLVLALLGYAANGCFMLVQRKLFPWIISNRSD